MSFFFINHTQNQLRRSFRHESNYEGSPPTPTWKLHVLFGVAAGLLLAVTVAGVVIVMKYF